MTFASFRAQMTMPNVVRGRLVAWRPLARRGRAYPASVIAAW